MRTRLCPSSKGARVRTGGCAVGRAAASYLNLKDEYEVSETSPQYAKNNITLRYRGMIGYCRMFETLRPNPRLPRRLTGERPSLPASPLTWTRHGEGSDDVVVEMRLLIPEQRYRSGGVGLKEPTRYSQAHPDIILATFVAINTPIHRVGQLMSACL